MTSLAEAYEENVGEVESLRRLYLGVGLFVAGALLVVVGILVSTTGIASIFGLEWWDAREIAGVLAGLGVPSVFVGIFSVLPTSQRVRAAAAIGAGISTLGVALFSYAYPKDWAGYGQDLTLPVVTIYFLGVIVTFWCLFVAVVNFKTRNDPGGTVTLELTREGEVRTVEVEKEDLEDFENLGDVQALKTELADATDGGAQTLGLRASSDPQSDGGTEPQKTGLGGVAFMGDTPDGETPTQTNQAGVGSAGGSSSGSVRDSFGGSRDGSRSGGRSGASRSGGRSGAQPTSDGGTATDDIRSPTDDGDAPGPDPGHGRTTDAYCGNCQYFEYIRTNEGMKPRCGYYGRTMDDMDACEEWKPNS